MNPFKRDQHLEELHTEAFEHSSHTEHLDADEARALHTYFHQGDFMRPDHEHPEGTY